MGRSRIFQDNRGSFREWFLRGEFYSISGIDFKVAQSNTSKSLKNVMRGIHYSVAKRGQAKWVTCISGSILDVVVDLRQDSDTFGNWILTKLESDFGDCLYVPDGFGHGFLSLEDNSSVVYNLTSKYQPELEFAINLFDETLKINWPECKAIISQRDQEAPSFLVAFPSPNT